MFIRPGLFAALAVSLCFSAPVSAATLNVIDVADPALNQLFRQSRWLEPVFEPLARPDPKTGQPMPVLATSWKLDDNLTSITFTLRPGLTFHDGKPVTSKNVVFSLQKASLPESNSTGYGVSKRISSIEAVDENTVRVTFKAPTSNLWDLFYATPIVDPDTFNGIANGKTVNGTGPFKWSSWKVGTQLTLTKYEQYRDASDVHYDGINVLVIGDPSAQQAALRSKRAQMGFNLTAKDARSLEASGYKITLGDPMTVGMAMNTSIPPFNNKLARQAVGYAVDRARLIAQANAGLGEATDLWWSSHEPGWAKEQADFYAYDPQKAREMVEKAGVVGADVPLIFPTNPLYLSYYNIIAKGLSDAGFKPRAVQLETNEAVSRLLRGDLGEAYLYYDRTTTRAAASIAQDTPIFRTGDIGPQKYESKNYTALVDSLQNATTDQYPGALKELGTFVLDEAFNQAFVTVPNAIVTSPDVDVSHPGKNAPVITLTGNFTGIGARPAQ